MKLKTHSGAKKRFKVTGSKRQLKIIGRKASTRHLLMQKAKRQKKMTGKAHVLPKGDARYIRKMLHV